MPDKKIKSVPLQAKAPLDLPVKGGSKVAQRLSARLAAVQILYQAAINGQDPLEEARDFIKYRAGYTLDGLDLVPANTALITHIVTAASAHRSDIEHMLKTAMAHNASSKGKALPKEGQALVMEHLLTAVLHAGIAELMTPSEATAGQIISDYLSVTDAFYEKSEISLVHALLDSLGKTLRSEPDQA